MAENEKKYGILPPLQTIENGSKIGHTILPGYSLEEWRKNRHKALRELIDNMTPEERAEYEKNIAESKQRETGGRKKCKWKRKRRRY